MAEFRMPSLGADMRTGTLVAWRAKPGDHLKYGDIIADVETDKGIMEIEVFENCTVEELLLEPDTKVPVGTPMARLKLENGAEKEAIAVTDREQPSPPPTIEAPTIPVPDLPQEERLRVSSLARKVATELGVDLTQVKGTGADGAIHQIDVEEAAKALKPTPKPEEKVIPPSPAAKLTTTDFQAGMRRAIAAAMSRSNREIPHYYLETRIDMSHALKWLEAENQKRSIKERILPVVLLIKAVAKALTDVPELNGYWIEDQLQVQEAIHIGFAISLRQGGLVTPAIHHADLKSLDELMATMRDLIERTRGGHLRSSELSDATMTLTSLGDIGVEKVYGVIYPPQVALVGFGKISEQPWAEQGMLDVRPVLVATLAGDHRATDGMIGARFLQAVNTHLQSVEKW